MTTKIAILGSCVSEDWYHFQDVRHRLDVQLIPKYQPSSLISITSKPVHVSIEPSPLLKPEEIVALRIDLDKSFLPRLAETRPDILIVELLAESRRSLGVISTGDSWITNNYILQRCDLPPEIKNGRYLNVMDEPDEYLVHFRAAARTLDEFMRRELPDCRIVLNQARWAEYFLDEEGELRSYPPLKQMSSMRANSRLDTLDAVFMEEVSCDRMVIDDVPIFADERHIWGASPDHFARVYYTSFAKKLGAVIAGVPRSDDAAVKRAPRAYAPCPTLAESD